MGASESTPSRPSNRTMEEQEQDRRLRQNISDVVEAGAVIAAGVATAWGICKMLSGKSPETEENQVSVLQGRQPPPSSSHNQEQHHFAITTGSYGTASAWSPPSPGRLKMNTDGAGAAAAWGLQRMLSGGQEENHHQPMMPEYVVFEGPQPSVNGWDDQRWSPPSHGRLKMNTDGAGPRGSDNNSGYGGILRDNRGNCVGGFLEVIYVTDNTIAEIQGILKGLEFLAKYNHKGSILESDSQAAVDWVTNANNNDPNTSTPIIRKFSGDIKKCRLLIQKNRIQVRWCDEKSNKCADNLATIARDERKPYQEFKADVPFKKVADLVRLEASMI